LELIEVSIQDHVTASVHGALPAHGSSLVGRPGKVLNRLFS